MRLVVSGDLDLGSAREFEQALAAAQRERPSGIVVDLRQLDFIDSRGLRAIITAHRLCEESGCELEVLPGEQARRLFELTGLTQTLPLGEEPAADGDDLEV